MTHIVSIGQRINALAFLCAVWFLSAAPALVEPAAGGDQLSAPTNETVPTYRGRRIAQTMSYHAAPWLLRQSREGEERASALLKALAVEPGQTVCDLGCGNGFHTLELARLVGPSGRVLGVDIQPQMLRLLEARAREAELEHIETILGALDNPKLPKDCIDLVLLVDVYHELTQPEPILEVIRAGLKPTGRVALVEFRAEDPKVPIKPLHKMSKRQIMNEFPPNGFKLVAEYDQLPWQHLMFFARDDSPLEGIESAEWRKSR
jgi:ubiquinone/menaquinone biosynthesis C-methylase UbiE